MSTIKTMACVVGGALLVAESLSIWPAASQATSNPGRSAEASTSAVHSKPEPSVKMRQLEELVAAGGGNTKVEYDSATGAVSFIGLPWDGSVEVGAASPQSAASAFVDRYSEILGVEATSLRLVSTLPALSGGSLVRFEQVVDGVPIFGSGVVVQTTPANRVVTLVSSVSPTARGNQKPAVSGVIAQRRAVAQVARTQDVAASGLVAADRQIGVIDLSLFGLAKQSAPRLTWRVEVDARSAAATPESVYVDAATGRSVLSVPKVKQAVDRRVCDWGNSHETKNCEPYARAEGDPPSPIADVNAAFDALGQVDLFNRTRFAWTSYDNADSPWVAITRWCWPDPTSDCPSHATFWDEDLRVISLGQGMAVDDLVAHEVTHAINDRRNQLEPVGQSGAIGESLADVFGELIDQSDGVAGARWTLGEESVVGIVRDMADPAAYNQPATMYSPEFVPDSATCDEGNDWCGVHINSGVGNRAAVLIADGGVLDGVTVTGIGVDKTALVFWEAQGLLDPTSQYRDLANALLQGCSNLIRARRLLFDDCLQVRKAIEATHMEHPHDSNSGEGTAVKDLAACRLNELARNDDGSTGRVDLPFEMNFFGSVRNSLFVNNNGNVTFDGPLETFTPFGLVTDIGTPIIAPFFADVDTRGSDSDVVTYGAASDGSYFCVNWGYTGVGYYDRHTDRLVRAQLILSNRAGLPNGQPGDFDIEFNYAHVGWETGDYSGGRGGLGGYSVRVGYSAGTGLPGTSLELFGSGVPGAMLDCRNGQRPCVENVDTGLIYGLRNSLQKGRYIFPVRSGVVPTGGTISGVVREQSGGSTRVLQGALVEVCPTDSVLGCVTSLTDSAGRYHVQGLPEGTYMARAFPPASSNATPASRGPIAVVGLADVTDQDITLVVPDPPSGDTEITPSHQTGGGVLLVPWTELTLTHQACAGATVTFELLQDDSVLRAGPLTEDSPGEYSTTLPSLYPLIGPAHLNITVTCPSESPKDSGLDVYIDPSGLVVDQFDTPVQGASVTLLRAESAAGPFAPVPSGSAVMSPANRNNPTTTDAQGHFGWDVIAGYYMVQARSANCFDPVSGDAIVESAVLTIPPPVTDLRLVLRCNTAPRASDAEVKLANDTSGSLDLRTLVSDREGGDLSFQVSSQMAHGHATCQASGTCTITPTIGFAGLDTFSYTVSDSEGLSDEGLVKVNVSSAPTPTELATSGMESPSPASTTATSGPGGLSAVATQMELTVQRAGQGAVTSGLSASKFALSGPVTSRTKLVLTARVTPATATGTVTFSDSGHVLATAKLVGGVAVVTVKGVYGGQQVLQAKYLGEGVHQPSISKRAKIMVKDAAKPKVKNFDVSTVPAPEARFRATDAGGVRSVLVRMRVSQAGSRKLGPWSKFTTLPGTATTWAIPVQGARVRVCVAVRAADYAGKVSSTHVKCTATK